MDSKKWGWAPVVAETGRTGRQRGAARISRVPSLGLTGWQLGAVVGMTVAVAVALGAIGELLITMHPPGVAGGDLAQGFGTNGLGGGLDAASTTFEAWRRFDTSGFSADLPSAFVIAQVWLALDLVFLVLYATTVLAWARPGGPLSGGETANTLGAARLLVIVLAVVDLVENSIALFAVSTGSASDALFSALYVLRSLKVFVVALPLVALLILLLLRKIGALFAMPRIRQALVMARPQILVVLVVAFALWYQPTSDVLLDIGTTQMLGMAVFGGLLSLGLAVGARVLIDRDRVAHDAMLEKLGGLTDLPRLGRRSMGSIVALLLAGLLAAVAIATSWRGLWGAALVIVSVLAASWVLQDAESPAPEVLPGPSSARLPAVLGLAPVGLFGIALIHWTLWADLILREVPRKAVVGAVMAVLAGALVAPIGNAIESARNPSDQHPKPAPLPRLLSSLARRCGRYGPRTWGFIVGVLTVPAVLLLVGTRVVDVRYLGPMSLVFGAAATMNLLGTWLVIGADWWRDEFGLPSIFKALRMRRIPVFLLLGLWLVINTVAFADPAYYDVVVGGTNQRVALEDAYDDWKEANITEGTDAVPLVVVAAEGGGLRAAYWTERVLSEVFDGSDTQPFALSGTSGGSIGIATFLATLFRDGGSGPSPGTGLADVPDPDFLSAVFQRWFTLDLASALLRQPRSVGDRAGALADALVKEIPALGTPNDYAPDGGPFEPVTVFNAADLQDGCLIPISTLSDLAGPAVTDDNLSCLDPDRQGADAGFPGAADIAHGCDGRGLSVATAAVASARSPFVTPAGRLEGCDDGVFYLGDGGYVDNSGAVSAAVVLDRLEALVAADNADGDTCIVPILLQIDNGAERLFAGGQSTGNPPQAMVVLTGAIAANGARHDIAKVAAASMVQGPLVDADDRTIDVTYVRDADSGPEPVSRYERIFPLAQAGRDATVGWLLSQPSKDALETQLETAVADAATLLSPTADLSCH